MTNTANLVQANFTIVHTEGVTIETAFSTSVKKAVAAARKSAWRSFEEAGGASNIADCWVVIIKGGRQIHADFASWF